MDESRAGWRTFGDVDGSDAREVGPPGEAGLRPGSPPAAGGWAGPTVGGRAWETGALVAADAAADGTTDGRSRILARWVPLALCVAAGAVAAGALVIFLGAGGATAVVVDAAASPGPPGAGAVASAGAAGASDGIGGSSGAAALASGAASIVVDVEGAVPRPGLARLPTGSRVGDAIAAAGGYAPNVDVVRAAAEVNLAAHVSDGDRIHVPVIGEASASAGAGTADASSRPGASTAPRLVDVNRATASELDALPGIGPVTAGKIIAARATAPFRAVRELKDRKVVTAATYAKIAPLVTVGP